MIVLRISIRSLRPWTGGIAADYGTKIDRGCARETEFSERNGRGLPVQHNRRSNGVNLYKQNNVEAEKRGREAEKRASGADFDGQRTRIRRRVERGKLE